MNMYDAVLFLFFLCNDRDIVKQNYFRSKFTHAFIFMYSRTLAWFFLSR